MGVKTTRPPLDLVRRVLNSERLRENEEQLKKNLQNGKITLNEYFKKTKIWFKKIGGELVKDIPFLRKLKTNLEKSIVPNGADIKTFENIRQRTINNMNYTNNFVNLPSALREKIRREIQGNLNNLIRQLELLSTQFQSSSTNSMINNSLKTRELNRILPAIQLYTSLENGGTPLHQTQIFTQEINSIKKQVIARHTLVLQIKRLLLKYNKLS